MTGTAPVRRVARGSAAVAACLAVLVTAAPAATADPFSDGQWYVSAFHLTDNQTVADGKGVKVALLDGVVDPSAPALVGADIQPAASTPCVRADGSSAVTGTGFDADHATAMATMLVGQGNGKALGVAPGATLLTYNIGYPVEAGSTRFRCEETPGAVSDSSDTVSADAVRDAVAAGARIVSMSFAQPAAQPALQTAILFAMRKGVVFVASTDDNAAAGSSRFNPPAAFNGVVAVNGIDQDAKQIAVSATGDPDGPLVVASAPGAGLTLGRFDAAGAYDPNGISSGSSPATAFVAGALAVTLSKYPQATGNQLIQSLARNAGGSEHGIEARALDGYGYGVVSLTSMLEHDPTTYPDENPTLRDGADPSTAEILEGSSAGASGSASSSPSSGASTPAGSTSPSPVAAADSGSSTGLFLGIGAGVLVLVVVAVLVAVLLSRRRRSGGPPPGPGSFPPVAAGGHR